MLTSFRNDRKVDVSFQHLGTELRSFTGENIFIVRDFQEGTAVYQLWETE